MDGDNFAGLEKALRVAGVGRHEPPGKLNVEKCQRASQRRGAAAMHAKDDDCLPFHAFPLALSFWRVQAPNEK